MSTDKLTGIIDRFDGQRIVVVGDLIVDEYEFGEIERISQEAPVPIFRTKRREYRLGGAANVANNIAALGGRCTLVGQVGKDETRDLLTAKLRETAITPLLIEQEGYATIKKTRFIAQGQQVIRIDREERKELAAARAAATIERIRKERPALIIVSDYDKGVVNAEIVDALKKTGIPIIVDPKPRNIGLFKGVRLVKPNMKEARAITGKQDVAAMGRELMALLGADIVITQSEEGASVFERAAQTHQYLPVKAREVRDVSGAGDTFIATTALALAAGATLPEAALLANQAAGIVVGKLGTATVGRQELKTSLKEQDRKILCLDELRNILAERRRGGERIVFTNGCFDILHAGHIRLLREAKRQGDVLVVGINTDASVRRLKGPTRPINNESDRAEVLATIESVDYVILFDEDTPCGLIGELRPDVDVKGGDYDPDDYRRMPEAKIVKGYGGRVHIIPIVEGRSTTSIIQKARGPENAPPRRRSAPTGRKVRR